MKKTALIIFVALTNLSSYNEIKNNPSEIKITNLKGEEIKCKIYLNDESIGKYTSGSFKLPDSCKTGDKYKIRPIDESTYSGESFHCPNKKSIHKLLTNSQALNLKLNSQIFNKWQELLVTSDSLNYEKLPSENRKTIWGLAALSNNELYHYRINEEETANTARVRVIVAAGNFFEVTNSIYTNPNTKYAVASSELILKVKHYQEEKNLTVTGKIDGPTLRSMANTTSFNVYNKDYNTVIDAMTIGYKF